MRNHHKKPKCRGGGKNKRNISKVNPKKHDHWHIIFGHKTPHQICEEINKKWIDPDFKFVCVHR